MVGPGLPNDEFWNDIIWSELFRGCDVFIIGIKSVSFDIAEESRIVDQTFVMCMTPVNLQA